MAGPLTLLLGGDVMTGRGVDQILPIPGPSTGQRIHLTMAPMQSRRMRLQHASVRDIRWLRQTIERASRPFATRIVAEPDGSLTVRHTIN